MKHLGTIALIALLLLALSAPAFASGLDFDGAVVGSGEVLVAAPIGGKAEKVAYRAGEKVEAGDVLVSLKTTKVYAPETGTVTGLFAAEGDSITAVESRYGAVMYIEPTGRYTIAATTSKAYDSASTKYIHVGETVYLACTSDGKHSGAGIVTAVSGTSYTVEVTKGTFYMGETVNVYRSSSRSSTSRLGRGDVERIANVSVTGTGSIVKLYVKNGDSVTRGDLLFETLTGEYDAYYCTGAQILSPISGILSQIKVSQGDDVTKDAIVAGIYPVDGMQIEFSVTEADLSDVHEGDPVDISFNWSEDLDGAAAYTGTITSISHVAATSDDTSTEASYSAYVDFAPGDEVRVGMTVVVSLQGADNEAEDETDETADGEEAEAEDAGEEAEGPGAEPAFGDMRQAPGDMPDGAFPEGEFPEGGLPGGAAPDGEEAAAQ